FFPIVDSRGVRTLVARGIIEYSEVIQPLPWPFRKAGTDSSTDAVQITRVLPISINTAPSACPMNPGVSRTERNWSVARPSTLISIDVGDGEIHRKGKQKQAMSGEGLLFNAADQNLYFFHLRQVVSQGVHHRVNRSHLIEHATRMIRRDRICK